MFASEWGRKLFIKIMLLSWAGMLLPWFSFGPQETGYWWGFYGFQYVMIQMFLLGLSCNIEPEKDIVKRFLPALTEVGLLSFPLAHFWQLVTWHTLYVTGKISLSIGLSTAYPTFWIAFVLSCIPILSFPVLRRWKGEEIL